MFDFDAGKLLIIGVIALIVIGPKELPRVLRQVGQAVGRMRRMAAEFQGQFMDAMKEADLQSIREEVEKLNRDAQLDVRFDPARDIRSELTQALETAPAATAAAPALEAGPVTALPTDNFAIPRIDPAGTDEAVETALPADSGMAEAVPENGALASATPAPPGFPVEESESVAPEPAACVGAERPPGPLRKRKILLPKRSPPRRNIPHEVWNRTGSRRGRLAGTSS